MLKVGLPICGEWHHSSDLMAVRWIYGLYSDFFPLLQWKIWNWKREGPALPTPDVSVDCINIGRATCN
jgi:hypothetical protein